MVYNGSDVCWREKEARRQKRFVLTPYYKKRREIGVRKYRRLVPQELNFFFHTFVNGKTSGEYLQLLEVNFDPYHAEFFSNNDYLHTPYVFQVIHLCWFIIHIFSYFFVRTDLSTRWEMTAYYNISEIQDCFSVKFVCIRYPCRNTYLLRCLHKQPTTFSL
jgi:hypothetical protein